MVDKEELNSAETCDVMADPDVDESMLVLEVLTALEMVVVLLGSVALLVLSGLLLGPEMLDIELGDVVA